MAAVENRAEGPSGPAPTNLVELPKLAPRPRRRPRLVRLVLLVLVPLIAVVIASPLFSHRHSWFARLAGQTWSRSGF
jgi:hypothetical protein